MTKEDLIEKAHQPGDVHPKYPNLTWQQNKNGKWTWLTNKTGKKTSQAGSQGSSPTNQPQQQDNNGDKTTQNQPQQKQNNQPQQKPQQSEMPDVSKMTHKELVDWAKKTKEEALLSVVNSKSAPSKFRQIAYDELKNRNVDVSKIDTTDIKTTSKYTYKTKKPEVDIKFSKFTLKGKSSGRQETKTYSEYRDKYKDLSDDALLNVVNSRNLPGELRHIAYELASERNIPEDKIDVTGRLQNFWDNEKSKQEDLNTNVSEDEEWESVDTGLGDFDVEDFMSQFPEHDNAWLNPNDRRVLEAFGGKSKKLDTIAKRQLYDNFVDYQKRLNPKYVPAKKQLSRMKKGYLAFLSGGSKRPLLIASGGAGVGKTYGLRQTLENYMGKAIYNEEDAQKAEEQGNAYTDYDAIFAPQTDSLPKLAKFLSENSDKIVIFDDNDAILTNPDIANVMKTLSDTNPKARYFPLYDSKGRRTGKNGVFKGKMIILTNKTTGELNNNEDANAVLSRASKQEINFTVQENIDTLKDRFMKMDTGIEIPGITDAEEKQIRQEIFDYIVKNKNKLDPQKFTVRKFIDVYEKVAEEKEAERMAATSADAAEDFEPEDWRDSALNILNKAKEDDLTSYNVAFYDPEDDWDDDEKERLKPYLKKLDSESEDENNTESIKDDKKIKKGIFDDMSLFEAENLLLN